MINQPNPYNNNIVVLPNQFQTYNTQPNVNFPSGPASRYLTLRPDCLDVCFMLPFPFFCIGCHSCLSVTAKFSYSSFSRVLDIVIYPGFLFCCSKSYSIPLSGVRGLDTSLVPNCQVNQQPAYQLILQTTQFSIAVTGAKTHSQIQYKRQIVEKFLTECQGF